MLESTKDQTVEALGIAKDTTPVPRARPQAQQEAPPPLSARAAPVESKKEEEPVTPENRIDVPIRPLERITRNAAYALGVEDAITKAKQLSANERQYNKKFREGRLDNDTGEDTLRHLLGGGLIYGDRDKLNVLEKLGRSVAGTYYDYREQTYLGGKSAHEENNIDLNNNEYGRLLRAQYPKEGDFVKRSIQIVEALGKNPKLAENFAIKNEDGEWVAPMLSSVGQDKAKGFAEGGMNTNMNDEMSSMLQEAPEVDPVSGNEVPIGSEPKEVRDDIPARLSEGEMVIPADVVKFFGVEYFMKLRDKAKKGFARMEEMGQMGNGDAASGPDELFSESGGESEEEDLPFTLDDFDVDEEGPVEAAEGLYVDASNYNDILKDIFNNTKETDTDNTPTPDPTQAPDFDNTKVDGEDFQSYFKDNPGFSQSNLVSSLGEGDAGLKNYNYLVTQLFGKTPELKAPIEEFYKNASSGEQEALTNYLEVINNGIGAASRTDGGEAPQFGGSDDAGDTQTSGMSVSEMSSNPTAANAASLSSFGALSDTALGRAALSAVDQMISATISPVGLAGRVGGSAAAAAASGLASIMGLDLSQVNNVATKEAFSSKQIGAQMASFVGGLTAVDLANMTAYNNAVLSGVDVNGMAMNGIGMVSFTDPATGQTTVGQSYGPVGNDMTAVATNDVYGSGVSIVSNKDAKVTPFGLNDINAAQKTNKSFDPYSFSLAIETTPVDNKGFGIGLGVDQVPGGAASQPAIGPTNNSVNPNDISFDNMSYASKSDLANIGNLGNIGTPGLGAGLGAGDVGTEAGGPDGGGYGGGNEGEASDAQGASDVGSGGADGGDGGTGDAGGTDGSEFKHGGFVKRRKKKKKQYAKGGLATRR
jgi:hypothetical protein